MEGARIERVETRRADLRSPFPPDFAARLEGQRVRALRRRAKYLLAELESGETLLMHLGMSGSFRVVKGRRDDVPGGFYFDRSRLEAHDHVLFTMSSGVTVIFNDPRRFGLMTIIAAGALTNDRALSALGPEPLDRDFNATSLAHALKGKKTTLKAALSDQRVVAGLGNIYVCEALHRGRLVTETARIHARDHVRHASTCGEGVGRCHSSRAQGGDCQPPSAAGRAIASASTIARVSVVRGVAAQARSNGSCRPGARRFSVPCVNGSARLVVSMAVAEYS